MNSRGKFYKESVVSASHAFPDSDAIVDTAFDTASFEAVFLAVAFWPDAWPDVEAIARQ
jgi:hypothetical protein